VRNGKDKGKKEGGRLRANKQNKKQAWCKMERRDKIYAKT